MRNHRNPPQFVKVTALLPGGDLKVRSGVPSEFWDDIDDLEIRYQVGEEAFAAALPEGMKFEFEKGGLKMNGPNGVGRVTGPGMEPVRALFQISP